MRAITSVRKATLPALMQSSMHGGDGYVQVLQVYAKTASSGNVAISRINCAMLP
jgi:hypothetical protein